MNSIVCSFIYIQLVIINIDNPRVKYGSINKYLIIIYYINI